MRYTDAKEVLVLASNIIKDTKKITGILDELDNELKTLERTFLDDGIEEVKAHIGSIRQHTEESTESAVVISTQLVGYADLLMKGKK